MFPILPSNWEMGLSSASRLTSGKVVIEVDHSFPVILAPPFE